MGDLAYVGNQQAGLRVLDISNPAAPQEVGYLATFADVFSAAISNDLIYYADGSDGLVVARLTDVDLDDVPDFRDNCPATLNPDQLDVDDDGRGGCDRVRQEDRSEDVREPHSEREAVHVGRQVRRKRRYGGGARPA